MRYYTAIIIAATAATLVTPACSRPEPAQETTATAKRDDAAAELDRKRNDATAQMEKRLADVDRRWSEMQQKLQGKTAAATAPLTAEVKEDLTNVREAVADLKTTTPANWWERHERAMQRAAADIEEDVRRFAKGAPTASPAAPPASPVEAAPFESRRDQFVTRVKAQVDTMERQLKDVRATGAEETELEDTRARLDKLKEDVDRLARASADDWWDISSKRVGEYLDRLEGSVRRLDDNKP